ncbi:hypothetical protein PsorP6_015770 [Peronosclerospora sorghi]|uniref:Uncharacterized protein n=1 Tax=Peronosclerospora sorghi TaxID=230839 RepID=A0ACC0WMT4_9STRA|nr:hypothetical protein PsorP6_015770 [Peronosclerospora sorghi]
MKKQVTTKPTTTLNLSTSLRPRRILTLGDGNFSYSLALVKKYQQDKNERFQLTATSYDSFDELIEKYPEAKRICFKLKELGVHVLHRVDATNIRMSLVAAGADASVNFDLIVFNHPHCGEENVRRHQSLLSHFYTSALGVLAKKYEDEWSGIFLSLAEGQSERWQAMQRALKAGLKLYRQVDNVDEDGQFGVVYDRKRHQNGKSFHQVLLRGEKKKQSSTLLIFRRKEEDGNATLDCSETNVTVSGEKTKSHKRKAESHELVLEFPCTDCGKCFKSAQGVRTHKHMVHELRAGETLKKVFFPCECCDRTFKNEDARRQHELAKHGRDPLIKPDWFEMQQTASANVAGETIPKSSVGEKQVTNATLEPKTCSICALSFPTVQDFDAHWIKLLPRASAKRKCSSCHREFDEARALRQHQNFCKSKISNEVRQARANGIARVDMNTNGKV